MGKDRKITDESKPTRGQKRSTSSMSKTQDHVLASHLAENDIDSSEGRDQSKMCTSGGNNPTAVNGSSDTSPEDYGGTFPNPSTFAERVMHVLENEIAPTAIWWLEDGENIALHPDEMKRSRILETHFPGNRFSNFVRSLTRWGFKRVSTHDLPEPVLVMHNSLFQQARPQLVQYMMMDSDVQDVFDQHQRNLVAQRDSLAAVGTANISDGQSLVSQGCTAALGAATSAHPHSDTPVSSVASVSRQLLSTSNEDTSIGILQQMLQLSERFLGLTSTDAANIATLRSIVQLLLVEGGIYLQHQQVHRTSNAPHPLNASQPLVGEPAQSTRAAAATVAWPFAQQLQQAQALQPEAAIQPVASALNATARLQAAMEEQGQSEVAGASGQTNTGPTASPQFILETLAQLLQQHQQQGQKPQGPGCSQS